MPRAGLAAMPSAPAISFVIPCYNEAGNLPELLRALRAAVQPLGLSHEFVITDDCSQDNSWAVLKELAAADPRVRGQRFARNCGQSAALWAGMKAARGEWIVTLDADLQNDPRDLPRLLEKLGAYDCVCGSRVAARRQGDTWLRVVSSRIANWVRNRVSGDDVSDAGCNYRAFKRACVQDLKFFKGMHRFLPTLLKIEGYTVTEVPIANQPRHAGQSNYGVWNRLFASLDDLLAVRWMKKRMFKYHIAETVN
jgi:dolichol-phosphate mannosyltransferase